MTGNLEFAGHGASVPKLSRRRFMRVCVTGLGLVAMGSFLHYVPHTARAGTPLANHKRLVVIFLRGGNDGLNTVVPVGRSRYFDRRPTIAIPDASALALNGVTDYKFHPAFANLRTLYDAGQVAVVRQVGYPSANLSHFVSEDIWSYGVRGNFGTLNVPISGWIARYADTYANGSPMGVVSIGQGLPKDFVGGTANPFVCDNLTDFRLNEAWNHTNNHYLRVDFAKDMLQFGGQNTSVRQQVHEAVLQSYDLSDQVQQAVAGYTSGVTYGTDALSLRMKDIATLIQGGFDSRIFYTGIGGFDTHSGQATTQATLLGYLDAAIGAFAADMQAMNIWNDTCILVVSEFGRRNYENGSAGTDHGHANYTFAIGGAVNGGFYGPDITNTDIDRDYLAYQIDFRTILKQMVERHLGNDPAPIFPEALQIPDSPGLLI